jgi:hypothetical protein
MSNRQRVVSKPTPPPDFYYPPKLGGDPDVPRAVVTHRTTVTPPHEVTISGTKGLVELPYGRQRLLAGPESVLYSFKPPGANELWYIVPLGFGELSGVVSARIWTNGAPGAPLSIGTGTGPISLWFRSGASTQPVDALLSSIDTSWNEPLRIGGAPIAYALIKLSQLDYYWREGLPTVEIIYDGLLCYDPRDGLTKFTRNSVLQFYDFLRRREGKALASPLISEPQLIAAANIADELMSDGTRRYESDVMVRDSADVEDWIKVFRLLCDGFFTWRDNQFHLILDRPTATSANYTDADLIADFELVFDRADSGDIVNHIRVLWLDPANGWAEVPHDEESAALQAGLEARVTATYRMPWIRDAGRAKRLAVYLLNSLQFDGKLSARWAATATATVVGDVVTQSATRIALGAQSFRVLARTLLSDNSYEVTLGEYNIAKYSDAVVSVAPKIASTVPDADAAPPDLDPALISATENQYEEQSGVVKTRGVFTWSPPAGYPFFEAVEIYSDASGAYAFVGDYKASPSAVPLHEVDDAFNFRIVVRNIFGKRSAGVVVPFTAHGKTLPPTNVPFVRCAVNDGRVRLFWQKSIDVDLIGYEVRRKRGDFASLSGSSLLAAWESATPIGKPVDLTFEDDPPLGVYTYFLSAYDSGKRYSAVPAACAATVETVGPYVETASGLLVYEQVPGEDYIKGIGNLVCEGATPGRQQFLLSRDDTFDDIAAYMTANSLATLEDYDAIRNSAELCFPLPENASGKVIGMGTTIGGSKTRNIEYRVRVANEQRIGRTSFVESHQIAEAFCGAQFGSKFTAGPAGMHPRFGLQLSTNDPWAQVMVRADDGSSIFYVTQRRIEVPLGVYDGVTGADGRWSFTLPAEKQLSIGDIISVDARPTSSTSFVQVVPETETNSSFVVRAYDQTGAAVTGLALRASVYDRGIGGSTSVITF